MMNKISKAAKKLAKADRDITHDAARHRDTPVIKAAGALSEGADQPPLLLLGVGTMVVGAVLRQPVMLRTGARMLASEAVATGIKSIVKRSVDRTRPKEAIETGTHEFKPGDSTAHGDSSFPSGHTAGAVAVAGSLAKDVPVLGAPAYALASGVAAVQMPRGKHYILDTVAGAVVGFVAQRAANVAVRVGERALRRLVRQRRS
jgi:membrane-associated phospholipid phosphatase